MYTKKKVYLETTASATTSRYRHIYFYLDVVETMGHNDHISSNANERYTLGTEKLRYECQVISCVCVCVYM